MNLPYPLFISLRYLKSKKKHRGVSFNTAVSVAGVAVGVMALLVVLSVMSGFQEDLQKKILGANAHVVIQSYRGGIEDYNAVVEKLKGIPHVVSVSPFVMGQVMVSSGKKAHGVVIRGIEPSLEFRTTDILKHIKYGSIRDLGQKNGAPWIIIGSELSAMLGVFPDDDINVISPAGEVGPLGMLPKVKQFRVAAVFEMGMFEYDTSLVLTGIKPAQDFFGYGSAVSGVELRLDDIYKAPAVRESIKERIGFPYYARDWMQMNRNLFSALKLEKFAMFIILILIVLVASFNIVSTLMMNVMEKQREIAILKSMGATNRGIMMVFMSQGLMIGLVGTFIGVTGGYILGKILNNYELIKLPADVYYLSKLPVKMKLFDFITVSVSAVTISFLSTLYPSYHAAKLNPVEPLRYE
ncbi:MAG: lipoprotein-releasing ABC transporter permease subunit [Nitrospirae bacterium]|nr:lipoprotein-releasing ABC transporter permease subunit [Nitrospirota bacterium]MCL5236228.1 lipoprotein-releasing ABC transporter permease subunit [Nitrospirota bacterium]